MSAHAVNQVEQNCAPLVIDGRMPAPEPFAFLPACLLPLGSRPVIEHVIGFAAHAGVRQIRVEAGERAALLGGLLSGGAPWNVEIRTLKRGRDRAQIVPGHLIPPELRAFNPARPSSGRFINLASLDGLLDANIAALENRLGFLDEPALEREHGCRVSAIRTRISSTATLVAPVILGQDVVIGAGARVGPYAVLTDRVVVRRGADVQYSILSGGMSVEASGAASGLVGIVGVVARVAFPGCDASEAERVAALPRNRRFFGVVLPKRTLAPGP